MHVTIVGAGTLGRVYGLRLAAEGCRVSFLVRSSRLSETSPFVIEQVNGGRRHDTLEHPERVAEIPKDASVVLVTVLFDQLDVSRVPKGSPDALVDRLRAAPPVPIVILTPILPKQQAALERAIGRRVVPAMPSVSGYIDDRSVVRYWTVSVVWTLLDDASAGEPGSATRATIDDLARRLTKAGISARLERDVASLNVATTTAFFPLIASINAGGGIEGVLADKDLLATALEAARESEALAKKLGKVAPWAHLLTRFIGPFTLKPAVVLARRLVPESVRFVETHFGPKLHDQHVAMGESVLDLGREHGVAMPALERLMTQLRARSKG